MKGNIDVYMCLKYNVYNVTVMLMVKSYRSKIDITRMTRTTAVNNNSENDDSNDDSVKNNAGGRSAGECDDGRHPSYGMRAV